MSTKEKLKQRNRKEKFIEDLQEQMEKVNLSYEIIKAGHVNRRTRNDNDKIVERFCEDTSNENSERIIEITGINDQ